MIKLFRSAVSAAPVGVAPAAVKALEARSAQVTRIWLGGVGVTHIDVDGTLQDVALELDRGSEPPHDG